MFGAISLVLTENPKPKTLQELVEAVAIQEYESETGLEEKISAILHNEPTKHAFEVLNIKGVPHYRLVPLKDLVGIWYWRHIASNNLVGPFDNKEAARHDAEIRNQHESKVAVEVLLVRTEDSDLIVVGK